MLTVLCCSYDESYGMLNEEISIMADTAKKDWFVEMLAIGEGSQHPQHPQHPQH